MNPTFLDLLRCPSCGGRLTRAGQHDPDYGVLHCLCSRYPVVAGIPIFKQGQIGNSHHSVSDIIAMIEAGHYRQALLGLITPPSPVFPSLAPPWVQQLPAVRGIGRIKQLAHDRGAQRWQAQAHEIMLQARDRMTACDLMDFYFRKSGLAMAKAYDYFAFRFGLPDHLVALSFASLIVQPTRPVLELACGFGHITRNLLKQAGSQPTVATDRLFFPLYAARNWIAPEAHYVCCEADQPLPFATDSFAAVFCADAFHYFGNKTMAMREIKRLTGSDGMILMTRLRNRLFQVPNTGTPLSAEEYAALVSERPYGLVADDDVLARYLRKQGPPLAAAPDFSRLHGELSFSLAVVPQDMLRDYDRWASWPHGEGHLALNPLYKVTDGPTGEQVCLRRTFPTTSFANSYSLVNAYLSEELIVERSVLDDLARGVYTVEINQLIDHLAVMNIPPHYY